MTKPKGFVGAPRFIANRSIRSVGGLRTPSVAGVRSQGSPVENRVFIPWFGTDSRRLVSNGRAYPVAPAQLRCTRNCGQTFGSFVGPTTTH